MMEAGRELDALVAEKVLGWRVERRWCDHTLGYDDWQEVESKANFRMHEDLEQQPCIVMDGGWYRVVPFYSTEIAAAWEVVERMNGNDDALFDRWMHQPELYEDGKNPGHFVLLERTARQAAHAICLAALAVVGVEAPA